MITVSSIKESDTDSNYSLGNFPIRRLTELHDKIYELHPNISKEALQQLRMMHSASKQNLLNSISQN